LNELDRTLENFKKQFDDRAHQYFAALSKSDHCSAILEDSKAYSFFSGGKRFRPFLSFLTGQSLLLNFDDVFPIGMATEMIHTYSLIHDDLPCMDNDDFRRGQLTNHKKFGEDIALLTGDALLTDAFALLTTLPSVKAQTTIRLIQHFSLAIGSLGMVSGQIKDMKVDAETNLQQLFKIHYLKTGKLIENSIVGVAIWAELNPIEIELFRSYGKSLGLAFQIKDDILDLKDNDQDQKSVPFLIGMDKTVAQLHLITTEARTALKKLESYDVAALDFLLDYNIDRQK
jgi:geranylgeranyl diphosphate synthase, type II